MLEVMYKKTLDYTEKQKQTTTKSKLMIGSVDVIIQQYLGIMELICYDPDLKLLENFMIYTFFLYVAIVINALAIFCFFILDKQNNNKKINKNKQIEYK